ncbi:nucleotidyltransferase family protein [Neolewinella maritima]|uniref:nucleotidyltransferase family protein n=1 Tax=Neolewinella maritima TaxID=1383882 RepID=UPI001EE83DEB|nr:nucleotidyltransferase family protein [Neolewinella maritima]
MPILLLAAGASKRMGQPKQLLPWGDTTLLRHAVRHAQQVSTMVYVVLGAAHEVLRDHLSDTGAISCYNAAYESGLGSSIACGLRTILDDDPTTPAVLVLLADQPEVDAAYLRRILAAHRLAETAIVATAYPQRAGVPALFPKDDFPALLELAGDAGAGSYLKNNRDRVHLVYPTTPLYDLDTPEEYRRHEGDQEHH